MPVPTKGQLLGTLKPVVPTPPAALKAHQEMAKAFPVLRDEVVSITVDSEETYQDADRVLAKVRSTRKAWNERMEAIIRPIRTGLDHIYALNRDVDKPMELLESQLKTGMGAYKNAERLRLQAEQAERDAEQQRLADEIEEKRLAEENARTAPMRAKIAAAREKLQAAQEAIEVTPVAAPVQANYSGARTVKKIRLTDLFKLLLAVIARKVPADVIMVNQVILNSYLKTGPDNLYLPVSEWPGVETYEDTQIVGR